MSAFRFLHAADLHLDSPLLGLSRKSADFAVQVDRASRKAFDRLVSLAIEQGCRFVVLAGDVFDGDLRDYASGLYFLSGIARLGRAGIRVFIIAGNHDAENRFFAKLAYSDNVHVFDHRHAKDVLVEDVGAVVHGRSYGRREVTENIALEYPAAGRGLFNVGVLHTACVGREGHHASYAPCTLEQLVNHGYQYWALGHVHGRALLSQHPHVVYPGNLQGRSPRETGPKGATIVEVHDGTVVSCVHHDLDEVRWASEDVEVTGCEDRNELVERVRAALSAAIDSAAGRPVALRLALRGRTDLHGELLFGRTELREDVEAVIETMQAEVWLERLDLLTAPEKAFGEPDPTIAGRLGAEVQRLAGERGLGELMQKSLADVRAKLPSAARVDELFDRIRAEAPQRALELALELVSRHADR